MDGTSPLLGNELGSEAAVAESELARTDTVTAVAYMKTRCLRGSGTQAPMRLDPAFDGSGDQGRNGLVVIKRSM